MCAGGNSPSSHIRFHHGNLLPVKLRVQCYYSKMLLVIICRKSIQQFKLRQKGKKNTK